jgi:hypothetical protein
MSKNFQGLRDEMLAESTPTFRMNKGIMQLLAFWAFYFSIPHQMVECLTRSHPTPLLILQLQ